MSEKANADEERGSLRPGRLLEIADGPLGAVALTVALAVSIGLIVFWSGWLLRTGAQVVGLLALIALWRRWVGPGLGRLGARPIELWGRELRLGDAAGELLAPAVVLTVVWITFWRLFLGDVPLYNDHSSHLYQGWVMAERLLPSGRLSGWVHTRGAGYPAGVLYPIGANLLLALVRGLTPSSLGWDQVYAIAFLCGMSLVHLSSYAAARLLAGRAAGVFAGVLSAVDPGVYRQAGWTFSVHWGVWPVGLSAAMAVLALVMFHRSLARAGAAGLVPFALLAGVSMVTHPLSVVFLGLVLPAAVIHSAIEVGDRHPLRVMAKGGVGGLLALGVAAFWLVPFIGFRDQARTLGTGSITLRQQLEALFDLDFFPQMWEVGAALALLAAVVCWRRRWPGVRLLTLLLAGVALLVSGDTLLGLELDLLWSRLANLQPDRFYLYLRIIAYILAGVGFTWVVSVFGDGARERAVGHLSRGRRAALTVAACLVLGPAVVPGAEALIRSQVAGELGWNGRPPFWDDYMAAADFIRRHATDEPGLLRTTWQVPSPNRDWHTYQSSPIYTGLGYFHAHAYYTVSSYDRLFEMSDDPETLRLLGVRYRVGREARADERELFRAGDHVVFEVPGVTGDPFTVEGRGEGELLELEDELIRVRVTGVAAGDGLLFHVPHFPNWRVTLDGEELPIELVDRASLRGLMQVELPGDGVVELRYRRGGLEAAAAAATVVTLLLCLVLGFRRRLLGREPVRRRVEALEALVTAARLRRASLVAAAAAAAGVVLLSALYLGARAEHRRSFDAVQSFDRARVWSDSGQEVTDCLRSWRGAYTCGPYAHQWVGPRYVWTTMGHPRGVIYAHPSQGEVLHIEYPEVTLGRSLVGGMGIVHEGRGSSPVELVIHGGERELFSGAYDAGIGWDEISVDTLELEGEVVPLRFSVSCDRPNNRLFVFRAWVDDERVITEQRTGDRVPR